MVTATILGMALSTFLQAWGGRLGSGLTLIHIPDPLLVLTSGLVASRYGAGGWVNLDIKLLHQGPPLPRDVVAKAHPNNLLELDDDDFTNALDQTLGSLSHVLLKRLADRISSGSDENGSWLRLHFDH